MGEGVSVVGVVDGWGEVWVEDRTEVEEVVKTLLLG